MGKELRQFKEIKDQTEKAYKKVGSVHCPYFGERVAFNAKGLEHLKFSRHNHARPQKEQILRFRLFHLAPQALKVSYTLQGISHTKSLERVKVNNRWEYVLKAVTYYEFIAILENVRVRVIVKQLEGGEKYFWSIIPHWRIGKRKRKRILHSGHPETD